MPLHDGHNYQQNYYVDYYADYYVLCFMYASLAFLLSIDLFLRKNIYLDAV